MTLPVPPKFIKYPWTTAFVFVALILASLVTTRLTLGPEWVRDKLDHLLGACPTQSEGENL